MKFLSSYFGPFAASKASTQMKQIWRKLQECYCSLINCSRPMGDMHTPVFCWSLEWTNCNSAHCYGKLKGPGRHPPKCIPLFMTLQRSFANWSPNHWGGTQLMKWESVCFCVFGFLCYAEMWIWRECIAQSPRLDKNLSFWFSAKDGWCPNGRQ